MYVKGSKIELLTLHTVIRPYIKTETEAEGHNIYCGSSSCAAAWQ